MATKKVPPFNGMRYAHKTIRNELTKLEELSEKLRLGEGQATELTERFAFIKEIINSHWAGEEEVLWPALEAKAPQVTFPYTLDHQGERDLFRKVDELLSAYNGARSDQERASLARQINREMIAMHVAVNNHSRKEDTHIIPLVEMSYTTAEQGALSGKMVAHLPRLLMPRIIATMMGALTNDERADLLALMLPNVPPPAVTGTAEVVKGAVSPPDWEELVARLPALTAAPGPAQAA